MWLIDSDNIITVTGLRNVITSAYVNNATLTGILYILPAFHPSAAAAVDRGEGKVGIPCNGHGLSDGDSIRIERGINYNADYMVEAATSEDEIVITATYVGETFTGNEFIYEAVVGTADTPVTFSYEAYSNGNYTGKIPYTAPLVQGESYVFCLKEVSGSEQVLAKIVYDAGFQGM